MLRHIYKSKVDRSFLGIGFQRQISKSEEMCWTAAFVFWFNIFM